MSSASNGGQVPFQLAFSALIAEAIRQLQRQASEEGRGPQFLEAIRTVVQRLRSDPTALGEPLYRLPAMRLQVRCVAVRPLVVDFAVCEARPIVFLKSVKLLPASGQA